MPIVRRTLRSFLPALAVALFALATATHAHAATPTVLLLHGGGWHGGNASSMDAWRADFEAHGYRARAIAYPLGSVTGSIDFVNAVVQEERLRGAPVIAYGISAGGTIAAALAATGRVNGAVDLMGPTDFTRWLSPVGLVVMANAQMSASERRSASPQWRLNGAQTPQLLQCGLLDPVTTYDQCSRYVSSARLGNPDTTLQTLVNAHGQWPADRDRARAWVQARWPVTSTPAPAAADARARVATITPQDDGKAITIGRGARLTISLRANNPATGHSWRFRRRPNSAILRLVSDRTAAPARRRRAGASRPRTIVYKALRAGTARLELRHVRRAGRAGGSLAVTVKVR